MYKKSITTAIVIFSTFSFLTCSADETSKGFIEDSKLSLSSRSLYFNSNDRDGGHDQVESATGLLFNYNSGFTRGTVGLGIDTQALVGLHLDGGRGHHPDKNSFVPSDSDGAAVSSWSRSGAVAKARISKTELRAGNALTPNLPILGYSDGRLLPQSFQGGILTTKEIGNLTLTTGKLTQSIGRASSNYSGLSVGGGTNGSKSFQFGGIDWKATKNLKLQYYHAKLQNYYTQHFLGLIQTVPLGDDQSLQADIRYFDSSSDGRNGEPGYRFNNNSGYAKHPGVVDNKTWSSTFTYALLGHAFMLGYQQVGGNGGMVWLNNGSIVNKRNRNEGQGGSMVYLYTNTQINMFARAGENTTYGQYSYDFARSGIPGLTFSMAYYHGDDIKNISGGSVHSEWERDLRLDYVVQTGPLKGLGTTLRQGVLRGDGSGPTANTDEVRLIFNYTYAFN